jgi:hypothetical protein
VYAHLDGSIFRQAYHLSRLSHIAAPSMLRASMQSCQFLIDRISYTNMLKLI